MTTILVAVDGSRPAEQALAFALDQHPDADLVALSVLDPSAAAQGSPEVILTDASAWNERAEARAQSVLDDARRRAADAGVDLATEFVYGSPARAIVEYAADHHVDQVVVGSHGRDGVSRLLLGSVAETVVRRSPVPVTVVR
jgi:nucleotide-binding universal stress UspA family protein